MTEKLPDNLRAKDGEMFSFPSSHAYHEECKGQPQGPPSGENRYFHVSPSFSVIQSFSDLEATIKALHTPRETPSSPFSSNMNPYPSSYSYSMETASSTLGSFVVPSSVPPKEATVGHHDPLSSSSAFPAIPRVLCFWDIDDTLVAPSDLGMRQQLMFEESQLRRLFQRIPSSTRHLLLSQGSVDDVFVKEQGALYFLQKYFLSSSSFPVYQNPSENGTSDVKGGEDKTHRDKGKNHRLGRGDRASVSRKGSGACCSSVSCVEEDALSPFFTDTSYAPIHLTRLNSCRKDLSCHSSNEWAPRDSEGNPVRWLMLRPGLWGISLARLSSLVQPSSHTAFVDGKQFKKMDIVWSFAASGYWDRVFFIDNNLCEVGIIRYGMSYHNAVSALKRSRECKVFLSDFSLLRASEELYRMEISKETQSSCKTTEAQNTDDPASRLLPSHDLGPGNACSTPANSPSPEDTGTVPMLNGRGPQHPLETVDATVSEHAIRETRTSVLPKVKQVDLVVAHLHFFFKDFYNIRQQGNSRAGTLICGPAMRNLGHPAFFDNRSCTDEEYEDIISRYIQTEKAICKLLFDYLNECEGAEGSDWKKRWRPNISNVLFPQCRTALASLKEFRTLCVPIYSQFIHTVCQQLAVSRREKSLSAKMARLAEARKAANDIYVELWTGCPLLDPLFVIDFAQTLYQIHCSDAFLSEGKISNLRKRAELFILTYNVRNSSPFSSKDG